MDTHFVRKTRHRTHKNKINTIHTHTKTVHPSKLTRFRSCLSFTPWIQKYMWIQNQWRGQRSEGEMHNLIIFIQHTEHTTTTVSDCLSGTFLSLAESLCVCVFSWLERKGRRCVYLCVIIPHLPLWEKCQCACINSGRVIFFLFSYLPNRS